MGSEADRSARRGSPSDPPGQFPEDPDGMAGAWWTAVDDPARPPPDEYDTPAEVDAVFRTQRRVAFAYLVVFLAAVLAMPLLTVTLDWWSSGRLIGAVSPNFAMAAAGLYVLFLAIGVGAASLASAIEDRMLGSSATGPPDGDPP